MDIEKLISRKEASIALIGLGYVGLPLALLLASKGFKTIGIDRDSRKIKLLSLGTLPIAKDEPGLKQLLQKSRKNFKPSQPDDVKSDVFIIIVNTPVDENKNANNEPVLSATELVAKNLRKGNLVIIESTVAPLTTEKLIIPKLEESSGLKVNEDFFVVVCPERIRPNHVLEQLTTFSRVIGASSLKAGRIALLLYRNITSGDLDITNTVTAEAVKTIENSSRDVQIAFANEMALLCEKLGVNVWDVRKFINKDPFKTMLKPGAGVGGHCLPDDPWLLNFSTKGLSKLIPLSRKINDKMPSHMFFIIKKILLQNNIDLQKARIVILGYSYTEETDDDRNSPTKSLIEILKTEEARIFVHDPFIDTYKTQKVETLLADADCLVLMVAHDAYKKLDLVEAGKKMRNKIIIDGRNFFDKEKAQSLGFIYKGVGNV